MTQKIFGHDKMTNIGLKKRGPKKFLGPKTCWVKNILGSKKLGKTKCWPKKIKAPRVLAAKNLVITGSVKILGKELFGSKQFWDRKTFGPKK